MQNQVIPNGSKVDTEYGVFEVLDCCIATDKYFCYKKYFTGHSGEAYFGHKYIDTKYEGNCWWFNKNEVSLIEEKVSNLDKQPKFKKGDKVIRVGNTSASGVEFGEVYTVDNPSSHRGFYCGELHNHVTLVEVKSTPSDKHLELYTEQRNYREMKPTDRIKVCIGDNEFEVPLGDLVHTTAVLGSTNGCYGFRVWKGLVNSLGECGFIKDSGNLIEVRDKQKEALDYFFKPYYDKQQQEKDELKTLIASKMEEVEALVKQLNQLNQM